MANEQVQSGSGDDARIGVYLCHCGANIAGVVNIDELEEFARTLPHVVQVAQYKFMCSEPGQAIAAKEE